MSLPKLTITITERVHPNVGATLAEQLRPFVAVDDFQVYERKGGDPAIQQLIQILGSIEAWHCLAAGGAVVAGKFASRMAHLLADDAYAAVKTWLGANRDNPIAAAATALSDAAKTTPSARVCVGLDIPDDMFGAVLEVSGREPCAIAVELVHFVVHCEKVGSVLSDAHKSEGIFNQPRITITPEGTEVRWMAQSDHKWRTVAISSRAEAA